jgi:glucosyl-3-phosphoglycerate synthase
MIINKKGHEDFADLLKRPLDKRGQKISLILPARHEEKTIGLYFPQFAPLMYTGCVDEIIIADSSDDTKTMDAALESAMQTEPFAYAMKHAIQTGSDLPVKTVNVFDPGLVNVFNGHKTPPGETPGKGRAMYLGMAAAKGDILVFLDSDFYNIHPRFVYGLVGPFENPKTVLSKATFELEDTWQHIIDSDVANERDFRGNELLLKSTNTRNVAKPLTKVLDEVMGEYPGMNGFQGPLSGGVGAHAKTWHAIDFPTHYGIEVSYLMDFMKRFPNGHHAYDVNLGPVNQTSADIANRIRMGTDIVGAVFDTLELKNPGLYKDVLKDPEKFVQLYVAEATANNAHLSDAEHVVHYADIMRGALVQHRRNNQQTLPPLTKNLYVQMNKGGILDRVNLLTLQRLASLEGKEVRYRSERPASVLSATGS